MAKPTLTIALSRRAILAGASAIPIAIPLAAQPLVQALAALPSPGTDSGPEAGIESGGDPGADAELFRRIATAEALRNRHARARRQRHRIREARRARAERSPLPRPQPRRGPIPPCDVDAYLQCSALFHRYADAVRDAVALPAWSLPGLHAKLRLAAIASRRGDARVYMYEDREWLEITLTDLRRLSGA